MGSDAEDEYWRERAGCLRLVKSWANYALFGVGAVSVYWLYENDVPCP